jgi:hypothetical protein
VRFSINRPSVATTFQRFSTLLSTLICAALLAGCTSTQILQSWRESGPAGPPVRKLAVFVLVKDDNVARSAENQAALAIGTQFGPAVAAIPGHLLGQAPQPENARQRAELFAAGFDAMLVSRLVSDDTVTQHVPPQLVVMPDPFFQTFGHPRYFYPYWAFPHTYWQPGYSVQHRRVIVETALYRLPAGTLAWSAVTESDDPQSTAQIVEELIELIPEQLSADGLLPPGR